MGYKESSHSKKMGDTRGVIVRLRIRGLTVKSFDNTITLKTLSEMLKHAPCGFVREICFLFLTS